MLIDRLDQTILSKAFRGELVPQDPNDEPASVLLERIKAEQAVTTEPRRGRGRWAAQSKGAVPGGPTLSDPERTGG